MVTFVFNAAGTSRALLRRPPRLLRQIAMRPSSTKLPSPKPGTKFGENDTSIPVPATLTNLPLWQRLGPLSRGFEAYARSQRKRPYVTQFFSSLVIFSLGDMASQSIGGETYDPLRTVRALVIGAGSSIPSYKWFIFLGNHFNYPSAIVSLATKVVVNQVVFAPSINSYFFGMQAFLSGDTLPEIWERLKLTVPTSVVNSCKLWPAVTAFSFTFIDAQYRSIFAGVIAIGWQTYLSHLNRQAEEVQGAERLKEIEEEEPQGEKKLQRVEA